MFAIVPAGDVHVSVAPLLWILVVVVFVGTGQVVCETILKGIITASKRTNKESRFDLICQYFRLLNKIMPGYNLKLQNNHRGRLNVSMGRSAVPFNSW